MNLVIVESPTKAKTIRKFLGRDYTVLASMGHVRDLPQSSADVPAELKKTTLGQLGVDPENDFAPLYLVPKDKTKTITELKKALKESDQLYLATDEDREGESISWHLMEILKPKVPVHRMVFHEITQPAIEAALAHPRDLDLNLVRAQETRRILDRLFGYVISPVLWKKIAYGLSAGRVQSPALKAIVDRERERMAFTQAGYWDVAAVLKQSDIEFESKLSLTKGKRVAGGKDFDEHTGALKAGSEVVLVDEKQAQVIAEEAKNNPWRVTDVTEKPINKNPSPPFITSSLQQEGNRKLGLSSKETMKIAQSLYEHGLITYMRTDSFNLSDEAVKSAVKMITERFGKEYLNATPRHYATTKGAQEAHEAIRPSLDFTAPDQTGLSGHERALYEMIWMRTLASQMSSSQQLQTSVTLEVKDHTFTSSGMKIIFPGFLRAYVETSDDSEQALNDMERTLPDLKTGDAPECRSTEALKHETKPPARFTEAGLIQYMEKAGIGRPSTYASIISTLADRGYVRKINNSLLPTFTAFAVMKLMEDHFSDLINVKFTSKMEEGLDEIAEGKEPWLPYLKNFYFGEHGLKYRVEHELEQINPEEARIVRVPIAPGIDIRMGKFGAYFEAEHPTRHTRVKATVPPEVAPADFTPEFVAALLDKVNQGPTNLGTDEATGKIILLRTGSYGPYLQLGEEEEGSKIKPKRISVPKNITMDKLDHATAEVLINLPRTLGQDPATGKDVKAGLGRFGPYVVCDQDFRSIKVPDDVLTITLERALEMLAQPKSGRGRGAAASLRTIGAHPDDGKPITLHNGKFGLYVKHVRTNATVPKDIQPDDVTLTQAVEWLAQRKAKGKKKRG